MYQNPHIVQTLDYSSFFLHEQNDVVNSSRHKINLYWYWIPKFLTDLFSVNELVKKVNTNLAKQLLLSKGLLAELKENPESIKGKNLNSTIGSLSSVIALSIKFHSTIQEINSLDVNNKYSELDTSESILAETIENLYDIERLLKRYNKIIPIETTQLAKSTAQHSASSLQKVIYGG